MCKHDKVSPNYDKINSNILTLFSDSKSLYIRNFPLKKKAEKAKYLIICTVMDKINCTPQNYGFLIAFGFCNFCNIEN